MQTCPIPSRKSQHGSAILIILTLIGLGAAFLLVSALNKANSQIGRDRITAAALAQAKQALIGWSAARGDSSSANARPGELPCPDTNNDGVQNYPCGAGAIGRIPYITLGIDPPRDASGEILWYAIDGNFRQRTVNNNPINSNTRAAMQVYASDGATLLTPVGSEAVAMIFSPGPPLTGQVRGAAQQNIAANYLDSVAPPNVTTARNNATVGGPFIQGSIKDASGNIVMNDQLVFITANDLMSVVEKGVANTVRSLLTSYYAANGSYPYPALYTNPNCLDQGTGGYLTFCSSDATQCRGRFPDDALPVNWSGSYALPGWFSYNLWGQTLYYGVGTNYLATVPAGCSATLTVNGTAGTRAVFFTAGSPLGAINRTTPQESTTLSDYLEDTLNRDSWSGTAPAADQYCTPGSASCTPVPAAPLNDHLYTLP